MSCNNIVKKVVGVSLFSLVFAQNSLPPATTTVYLYNAVKNVCITSDGSAVTTGKCDFTNDNALWVIPNTHNGYYRSKANPEKCLSIVDGEVVLSSCDGGNTLYRDGNFIKNRDSNDHCISNETTLKECDINDQDQIWFYNNFDPSNVPVEETPVDLPPETSTFYLYNAMRNVCITNDGTSVSTGKCDFTNDDALWEIPTTHDGLYRSKVNPEKCLSIVDGEVVLSDCNEDTTLYRDGNFIKNIASNDNCISSESTLKECDIEDPDQIWFYNVFDPSNVPVEETPVDLPPQTSTVYLYNAMRNVCITNDGTSVSTGKCDFTNDDALWEIPTTHDGLYRSKVNPEKCLSIVDGEVVLSDCNEDTTLYRDGNFIKNIASNDKCISSESTLKECDIEDPDQIWFYNVFDPSNIPVEETPVDLPPQTSTFYLYNAMRNVCITNDGTSVSTGKCDFTNDDALWEIPTTHDGLYRSKVNPEKCLSIVDGEVVLSDCNEDTTLYRDGNFIKNIASNDKCISSESTLKECDIEDPDQIWFYNVFDPSNVPVEETPVDLPPQTSTVYLYNAMKNVCITTDGTSVNTGDCDFTNDNALWEVPTSHNGNYRSKAYPEKCLSVVDDKVALSECNEENTLYRDGFFIRSPSSDNYCITSYYWNTVDLDYTEDCDEEDYNHIWFFNIWIAPATTTENVVPTTVANEENPTTTITEENPTSTITTTVTI